MNHPITHIDYESSSLCDIRKWGAYRYACDPSTRILMFAIAEGEGDPLLWRFDRPDAPESLLAKRMFERSVADGRPIYAHNSQFEHAVSRYCLQRDVRIDPPTVDQWRCTKAMCRRAAIPDSLANASAYLKLDEGKDKKGTALIGLFSNRNQEKTLSRGKERMKSFSPLYEDEIPWDWTVTIAGEKMTVAEAWDAFMEYCRQDVIVEREIHKSLSNFELTGSELDGFLFNARMNDRGVPVNLPALVHAQKLVKEIQAEAAKEFKGLTGFMPTQTAKALDWLQGQGFAGDALNVKALEAAADKSTLTPEGQRALDLRNDVSYAAVKKIPSMIGSACPDGFVRGVNLWHGTRTGRDTSQLMQAQNMKKSTISDSEIAYDLICMGADLDTFKTLWPVSPLEVIASCIRHFIQYPGINLNDVDYKGVEARITPWLSGDTDELDVILSGLDQYKVCASSVVFNVHYDEVTKEQRTVSKPVVLSCCFGTGGEGLMVALRDTYGVTKTLAECNEIVSRWRKAHSATTDAWSALESAATEAVRSGKSTTILGGKVKVSCQHHAGIKFLVFQLPSGRELYYPEPKADPVTMAKTTKGKWMRVPGHMDSDEAAAVLKCPVASSFHTYALSFYGKVPGKAMWGRVPTWGSRAFENCLTADTEVLTEDGWLPIKEVGARQVFDGVELVKHSGLKDSGEQAIIRLDGLGITPDHLIRTSTGWHKADSVDMTHAYEYCETLLDRPTPQLQRLLSHTSGPASGPGTPAQETRSPEGGVAMPLLLWRNLRQKLSGSFKESQIRKWAMQLCLPERGFPGREAPHVAPSGLCRVPLHAGPMQAGNSPSLSKLWGQGHQGLHRMAGVLREFLGRHGHQLPGGVDLGPGGQQRELLSRELPVGGPGHAGSEPPELDHRGYPAWTDGATRDCHKAGHVAVNPSLPLGTGASLVGPADPDGRHSEPVYDILDCGPRNRFVVRAPGGKPLIVHNCVQAIGADLLSYGCRRAESAGHEIFLIVHDQALAPANRPLQSLIDSLCEKESWAEQFPLDASGDEQPFYLKD